MADHPLTETTAVEGDRPWEPLDGPVRVGAEVRQDLLGLTTIGIVAYLNDDGDPWTAEGGFIGQLGYGTWYVRRPVQELPATPETAIVANDGHDNIEAVIAGETWRTREAILSWGGNWHAVWRSGNRTRVAIQPENITPGTWQEDRA